MSYQLDANHKDIIAAFEQLGCLVIDNAKVKRYEPSQLDIWVGMLNHYTNTGLWLWVEIKTPAGQLRPGQATRIAECHDKGLTAVVVRTVADVEVLYNKYAKPSHCSKCGRQILPGASICDECIPF